MSTKDNQQWRMSGHNLIFVKIMMTVCLSSLESLHRCRQVCRTWNVMIMENIWGSPSKRKIIKMRIERNWAPGMLPNNEEISHAKWLETRGILDTIVIGNLVVRVRGEIGNFEVINPYSPSDPRVITCAASLAHHGLLGSLRALRLWAVDLTSVPAEHLASLASSVTGERIDIENVSGCGLATILDNAKSKWLYISSQNLDTEETRALVRAIESRVEAVCLYYKKTLDIKALIEYSGQGKCKELGCYDETATRYRDQLLAWATSRNWAVKESGKDYINMKRMKTWKYN